MYREDFKDRDQVVESQNIHRSRSEAEAETWCWARQKDQGWTEGVAAACCRLTGQ